MKGDRLMSRDGPALAAVRAKAGVSVDMLFAEIVALLRPRGVRIGGVLQENDWSSGDSRPITRLRNLSDGSLIRISQDLGLEARGCRLDPGALAEAAPLLEGMIEAGADLLIINRFGKAEAEGTGLRSVIERAILVGVPVLTAVRTEYVDAWAGFHAGLSMWLPPDSNAILSWCRMTLGLGRDGASAADIPVSARW
jgi:hypothetical protein